MDALTSALRAGNVAARSDEAEAAGGPLGSLDYETGQPDSLATAPAEQAARVIEGAEQAAIPYEKRVATCAAKLALRGFSLRALRGRAFVISKWNLARGVADIGEAEQFLLRVGGGNV